MDELGAYLERVADLIPFRDVNQSGQLAKLIREYCIAFDENQSCCLCTGPINIKSRAEAKKIYQDSSVPCISCAEAQNKKNNEQKKKDELEINRRLKCLVEENASVTLNYAGLPDNIILVLLAINALVTPRLVNGTFCMKDCYDLAPWEPYAYIKQLYNGRYLLEDYYAAKSGTYFLNNGELWHKTSQLELFLPPDAVCGRVADLSLLDEHRFSDSDSLINLWLDYAVGDVLRYLLDQCNTYNHDLDDEAIERIKSTVRHGLQTYSVAELWSVMWKVVRDAASLANREYYNRPKATATIPTKIRKLLEIADQQGGIKKSWDRPDHHIAGSLGMVFFSFFEIDEYTPGSKAIEIFIRLGRSRQSQVNNNLHLLVDSFIRSTLESQDPLFVMECFADKIRSGLATEEAIIEVLNKYGEIFT
ncbi:hypothetical protein K5D36_24750 [Pseudomonas cichorii]|nr:hypothetical protein [Pseudomonas cichorii]